LPRREPWTQPRSHSHNKSKALADPKRTTRQQIATQDGISRLGFFNRCEDAPSVSV
jgi:hypothetical protein